jgi:transposase-like protein
LLAVLRHNENANGSKPVGSAAELFATGIRQAEVARQLGVSRQSVHLWYQRWPLRDPQGDQARPDRGELRRRLRAHL